MDFETYDPKLLYRKRKHLIGEGEVGGKAKGLAFSYESVLGTELEKHVKFPEINFSLTTEIFNDFFKENRIDDIVEKHNTSFKEQTEDSSYQFYEILRQSFMEGKVRDSFYRDIEAVIRTIGDCPMAVRSSSLLEDSKMLSFAGKYETCFSVDKGDIHTRTENLIKCIKNVWSSLYNPAARAYRAKHGYSDLDEAMGIVIEPMIGKNHGDLYYPEIAGICFSKVYRRPSTRIQKEAGVMRLCFGLGTRSVDRLKARLFYLSHPSLRPQGNLPSEISMSSQTIFDYIDQKEGEFRSGELRDFLPFILKEHRNASSFIEIFADNTLSWAGSNKAKNGKPVFSFSALAQKKPFFFNLVKELSSFLEDSVGNPVDIEFTYDTEDEELYLIQMRPLAGYEEMAKVDIPEVPREKIILKGNRMVSNGILKETSHIVYVDHDVYNSDPGYFEVAREIGRINERLAGTNYILVGPGRWGSTNPLLGVPVKYNEICNCGCLVEIGISQSDFVPELSYGTHFFLDLDVDGTLYLPVFEGEDNNILNRTWLENTPYEKSRHPAIRIYKGNFSVFLDGENEVGQIHISE